MIRIYLYRYNFILVHFGDEWIWIWDFLKYFRVSFDGTSIVKKIEEFIIDQ